MERFVTLTRPMKMDMEGKVVLVTGGGSGIGRATVRLFASHGALMAVADLDEGRAAETCENIKECEGALAIGADVRSTGDVENMVAQTVSHFGRLDVACNIAGRPWRKVKATDLEESAWDDLMKVNLRAMWLCMKHEIPRMLDHGGSIVNLASIFGEMGHEGASAYVAADHGVIGLTKTVAVEYAQHGIRVNAVCPSFVDTQFQVRTGLMLDPERREAAIQRHPMRRFGKPEEVAEAVYWLSSERASFVTGHALRVDGGYSAQ